MIELYVSYTCPFCIKVMRAAEEMGLQEGKDYLVVDAAPGTPGRKKVVDTGSRAMVPFLVDGDHWMYESDDIIAYLKSRYDA